MKARGILAVTLLVTFVAITVDGQSPMINYQGKVTDSDGQPLDGTYSIQFCIYDQETGGTALWSETQSVEVQNGIFNILLGSVDDFPSNLFNGAERWLQLEIEGEVLSSRQQIVSVVYALRADKANESDYADDSDRLDGHDYSSDWEPDGYNPDNPPGSTTRGEPTWNEVDARDYGRSGVAADLYEETTMLTDKYVNEGQSSSITSDMIVDGTIQETDLSFSPSGDGHSLDAADGSPVDAVYVDNDGKIGIGTTSPSAGLTIKDSGNRGLQVSTGFLDPTGGYGLELKGSATRTEITSYNRDTSSYLPLYFTGGSILVTIGNVGIGTESPSHPLHMGSGAHCTAGGTWTNASSIEYKENMTELETTEAIETLNGLTSVKFNYKVDKEEKHVGFIAEDVPELVASKDRKGLSPMDIVAVLTKVVQEQEKRITVLEKHLAELERR